MVSGLRLSRRSALAGAGASLMAANQVHALSIPSATARKHQGEDTMSYDISGRLLEVCTCNVLCPCWIGEDPDGGTCDSMFGWAVDEGSIEGIDVSGRVLALSVHIPGNVLAGNWTAVVYVDDQSTMEQQEALLKVFTGQLGGAIADIAALIGTVVTVERVPIAFDVTSGEGTMSVGDYAEIQVTPYQGATGNSTVLQETAFSTIPGSPAFVGKAQQFRRTEESHGLSNIDLKGHNAIQGAFRFSA
jgi:hypothetical protein